jgi:hypothetical protein
MADNIAVQSALDTIAVIDETSTKLPTSNPAIDTEETTTHITEPIQVDDSDVDARGKPRTLAIVAALYMVLFIAALDQTIIA